jgi:tetratricopeptide (TPR) repeat protein
MRENLESGTSSVCPNCRALNPPDALVCVSCGVHLAGFEAALPRFRQLQAERTQVHHEAVAERVSALAQEEAARGNWALGRQIRVLLIVTAAIGFFAVVGSAFLGNQVRLRNERLARQYESALACLSSGRYQCARDELVALLREDSRYPGARENLAQARYGLAEQYASSGRWQDGINELKAQLRESPDDTTAARMIQDMYDRWLADAIRRGDWWTVMRLRARTMMLQSQP